MTFVIVMARPKKDIQIRQEMCERFVEAMAELNLNASEVSRKLGYCNATTISKLQRGEAFVDVERLYLLGQLRTPEGKQIDLNWLITGTKMTGAKS